MLIGHIISNVAFCVYLPAEYGCMHPVFHVSVLQPGLGPNPLSPAAPLPLDDVAGECEVKDILDSGRGHSGPEYLVK